MSMLFKYPTPPRPETPLGRGVAMATRGEAFKEHTRVLGAVPLQPGRAQTGVFYTKSLKSLLFAPKGLWLRCWRCPLSPSLPPSSDYFCLGTFVLSCGSRPARGSSGKMAAPMSRGSRGPEPGAAPYGNFPNYSRFHPPEGRVSLLPQGLLRSLFPAATRPLLGLDVGCNSGERIPTPPGSTSCPGWRARRSHVRPPAPSGVFQLLLVLQPFPSSIPSSIPSSRHIPVPQSPALGPPNCNSP
ncbi:RNA 5'-monophosphate methyltransferase isoform X2 [Corvus moneduloides]|uniref:RNA 5'-monophosphate methyltransferase isoform X2 n=1 Tax=Corvus moneduloides TaxID=1196302 RepID=UPI001362D8F2|nr:RNA 5'-monophosphate methyltransferase isoform X2 [Corvus moneduloides]